MPLVVRRCLNKARHTLYSYGCVNLITEACPVAHCKIQRFFVQKRSFFIMQFLSSRAKARDIFCVSGNHFLCVFEKNHLLKPA